MGFGVTSLKNMRKFYEAWATIEDKFGNQNCRILADSLSANLWLSRFHTISAFWKK